MHTEDRVRLHHMIETAESALQFIAGRQRTDLGTRIARLAREGGG